MGEQVSVLMVEDHPVYRDGLVNAIERRDDLVLIGTADSAGAALGQLRADGADVVLLDVGLTDGSGIARLQDLLSAGARYVLVLSAHTDGEMVRAALTAGAAGFIAKDADRDEICDAIVAVAAGGGYLWPGLQATIVDELRRSSDVSPVRLSDREREVLALIAEGLSYPEIGARIYVSTGTVKTYATRAFEKLGVSGQAAAVAEAIRRGLIEQGAPRARTLACPPTGRRSVSTAISPPAGQTRQTSPERIAPLSDPGVGDVGWGLEQKDS